VADELGLHFVFHRHVQLASHAVPELGRCGVFVSWTTIALGYNAPMSPPSRPWYRLHALTWLVSAVVVAAMVAKNLDVNAQADPLGGMKAAYGWPAVFAYRDLNMPTTFWFDGKQVVSFSTAMLSANVAFGIAVNIGAATCVEKICRLYNFGSAFNLRLPLVAMAWVASYLAIEGPEEYWDWHVMYASHAIAWTGVALAWLTALDLAGNAWKWMAGKRHAES
jgi:hypothetical protein